MIRNNETILLCSSPDTLENVDMFHLFKVSVLTKTHEVKLQCLSTNYAFFLPQWEFDKCTYVKIWNFNLTRRKMMRIQKGTKFEWVLASIIPEFFGNSRTRPEECEITHIKDNLVHIHTPQEDYTLPYESFNNLVKIGKIKIRESDGKEKRN